MRENAIMRFPRAIRSDSCSWHCAYQTARDVKAESAELRRENAISSVGRTLCCGPPSQTAHCGAFSRRPYNNAPPCAHTSGRMRAPPASMGPLSPTARSQIVRIKAASAAQFAAWQSVRGSAMRIKVTYDLQELCVRYKDDEDDLVTMTNDSELADAVATMDGGLLRLTVTSENEAVEMPRHMPSPHHTPRHRHSSHHRGSPYPG
eukprot:IDg12384t1